VSKYWTVFAILMVGLALTVWAATFDLAAPWNWLIAVGIAVFKATCIVLVFMHVKYSSRLVQFLAAGTYFWLMLLFVLTGMDYFSRVHPVGIPMGRPVVVSGQPAAGSGHAGSGQPAGGAATPSPSH
jgi:cytochrome c oxidase subunit 4